MEIGASRSEMKDAIEDMWNNADYINTFKRAISTSQELTPLLSKISVALDTHLGGSLGMRSTRKQLQAIMHHVAGNFQMRVNSTSAVPATYFLTVCAYVGHGKSIYFRFLKELMNLLYQGVSELDKQVFDEQNQEQDPEEHKQNKGDKNEKPKFAEVLQHQVHVSLTQISQENCQQHC